MLNDVRLPPLGPEGDPNHTPKEPGVRPHEHLKPHVDPNQPGLHKTRLVGEPTQTDTIYAMPMEDRGSFFSLTLSAVVVAVFAVMLLIVWWTFFRASGATP